MENKIDRIKLADEWHHKGFNCAQSVLLAFADQIGMEEETAIKASCSFGGGMGYAGEVCGAVSGMVMALGLIYGYTDPSVKKDWYKEVNALVTRFKEEHSGMVRCGEFLPAETYPCADLIRDAVRMTEQYIESRS